MIVKNMKNSEIFSLAQAFQQVFAETVISLPVKVNFYIQKNKKMIISLAEDINEIRMQIIAKYGNDQGNGSFAVPQEKIAIANQELDDLLNIEQEVSVYEIALEDLDGLDFTLPQMETLMFMIKDPED